MIDTIRCHDKNNAREAGDAIGWENVKEWEFCKDGTVILYVTSLKELKDGIKKD